MVKVKSDTPCNKTKNELQLKWCELAEQHKKHVARRRPTALRGRSAPLRDWSLGRAGRAGDLAAGRSHFAASCSLLAERLRVQAWLLAGRPLAAAGTRPVGRRRARVAARASTGRRGARNSDRGGRADRPDGRAR